MDTKTITLTDRQVQLIEMLLSADRKNITADMQDTLDDIDAIQAKLKRDTVPAIIIEIQGGCYTGSFSTTTIDLIVRDIDNIQVGDEDPIEGYESAEDYLAAKYGVPKDQIIED